MIGTENGYGLTTGWYTYDIFNLDSFDTDRIRWVLWGMLHRN